MRRSHSHSLGASVFDFLGVGRAKDSKRGTWAVRCGNKGYSQDSSGDASVDFEDMKGKR
jgi:hypothetical protein